MSVGSCRSEGGGGAANRPSKLLRLAGEEIERDGQAAAVVLVRAAVDHLNRDGVAPRLATGEVPGRVRVRIRGSGRSTTDREVALAARAGRPRGAVGVRDLDGDAGQVLVASARVGDVIRLRLDAPGADGGIRIEVGSARRTGLANGPRRVGADRRRARAGTRAREVRVRAERHRTNGDDRRDQGGKALLRLEELHVVIAPFLHWMRGEVRVPHLVAPRPALRRWVTRPSGAREQPRGIAAGGLAP